MGYIYIPTNPSFPQYVKIGYAADVKQRLDELNRSSAVPFAVRVYASYEVDSLFPTKILETHYNLVSMQKNGKMLNNRSE